MVNKNYARGRYCEYKAIKKLKKLGYFAVRTAGSHSPCDVIAWNGLQFLLIQLKRIKKAKKYYPNKEELDKFKSMICPVNCNKRFWLYFDSRKRGEKWEELKL